MIDVRSPAEFLAGHIPGSLNIPLFDDREREAVGIRYKKEGRLPAVILGLELTGPKMSGKLEMALAAANNREASRSLLERRNEVGGYGMAFFPRRILKLKFSTGAINPTGTTCLKTWERKEIILFWED